LSLIDVSRLVSSISPIVITGINLPKILNNQTCRLGPDG
jgi:hypothetical protein